MGGTEGVRQLSAARGGSSSGTETSGDDSDGHPTQQTVEAAYGATRVSNQKKRACCGCGQWEALAMNQQPAAGCRRVAFAFERVP